MGPQKASFDSPLKVAKITIPVVVNMRYRNMRLDGSGAEPGMFGTTNFRSK
jgi:hypothetical protein